MTPVSDAITNFRHFWQEQHILHMVQGQSLNRKGQIKEKHKSSNLVFQSDSQSMQVTRSPRGLRERGEHEFA